RPARPGTAGPSSTSAAPELSREVAQVEPRHLVFERAQRDAQITRGRRHVPIGFLECAQNEVPLEGIARLLEKRLPGRRPRVELREVILEWKILVSDPFLVADGDEPLEQVFELANVGGPPGGGE